MASTSGSCSIWPCWAITMPNAAPTRPSPTITRTSAGQPPRATNGASQARPPASARQRFCWALSACRQTRAAPAQANATGQNSCELMPSPLLCMIHSRPAPRAVSASSMPQSIRRFGRRWSRMPVRLADSRPGAFAGRLRRHQQPERAVGEHADELEVIKATKAIRITSTGQPRCRARPVQTPPSQAPSATRVARRRPGGSPAGSSAARGAGSMTAGWPGSRPGAGDTAGSASRPRPAARDDGSSRWRS